MSTNEAIAREELEPKPELVIRAQTPEEEVYRVQEILSRMDWFNQHGYKPRLPDNPELTEPFSDEEKPDKLKLILEDYKPELYVAGLAQLEAHRAQIEAVFPIFEQLGQKWGFTVLPQYQLVVTRYGMSGSYDEKKGRIIMRVNDDGTFTSSIRTQPHHTPIHEMVHIGIEEGIVEKYELTQAEKERMVDLMVSILFKDLLPDYKIHTIGDSRIEEFVTSETIANLPEAIKHYTAKYPRKQDRP
jgi:hypothetical protein